MSIDFLPNRAGPEQRAQAANAAAVRQRLWCAPMLAAPVEVVEPEPEPQPEPEYPPLPTLFKPIVRDVLRVGSVATSPFKWRHIVEEVAEKHGVSFETMKGDNRRKGVTVARFEVCARLYDETGMSLPQIGRLLNKDHSTVLHAIRRHHAITKAGAAQ